MVEILKDPVVTTFEDGKYANDVWECVMALLSLNVSIDKIDQVITVVLSKLAKKNIKTLPSAKVKARLMQETQFLVQIKIADGTSKYHCHFQNFKIATGSGRSLSVALSKIVRGDSQSVFESFSETITDFCDVINNGDSDSVNNR